MQKKPEPVWYRGECNPALQCHQVKIVPKNFCCKFGCLVNNNGFRTLWFTYFFYIYIKVFSNKKDSWQVIFDSCQVSLIETVSLEFRPFLFIKKLCMGSIWTSKTVYRNFSFLLRYSRKTCVGLIVDHSDTWNFEFTKLE